MHTLDDPEFWSRCHFETDRLRVCEWHAAFDVDDDRGELAGIVVALLTPGVTQSLPEQWRGAYSFERATQWIDDRDHEGTTLLVTERSSNIPLGLVILHANDEPEGRCIRLGYLLAEAAWGQGLATELIDGFLAWSRKTGVALIVAGVERDNLPSRRVLEKTGFTVWNDSGETDPMFYEWRIDQSPE